MQTLHVLLVIAEREGRTAREISELTGLSQPGVSRNVAALGRVHRSQKPGLGLVEAAEDPGERRRKIYFLTKKGQHFIQKLISTLETDELKIGPLEARTADEYIDSYVFKLHCNSPLRA